jgi:hypothetical protein
MDDTITTIYCLCDDFLKAMRHFDDPQVRLTTAEVMTVPLVAATFFAANIDKTCRFLREYGYMPKMISKGRFNHRLHKIEPWLWQGLFSLLAEFFKRRNSEEQRTYAVDSFPVVACENIRISRCQLYPLEEHGGAFRGYISSKRSYFYGLRVHLVVTGAGEPVEFSIVAGSEADVTVFKDLQLDFCRRVRLSVRTRLTPITTTKTSSRKWAYTLRPSARRTQSARCQHGRST